MTTEIDIKETTVHETGLLKKSGGQFALVALTAAHMEQILALQEAAFKSLAADEQHYLLQKDRGFFTRHFAHGGAVIGVVADGKLVAQSIVFNPSAAHPASGMTDMAISAQPEQLTVLEGVVVDPAYRGNKLMDVMVRHWLGQAAQNGRTEALAEVAVENAFSWSVFLKEGLHIESLGTDPADNSVLYNLHGHIPDLKAAFNTAAKKQEDVSTSDLARQKELLAQGHKGVAHDRAKDTLTFAQRKKACGGFGL